MLQVLFFVLVILRGGRETPCKLRRAQYIPVSPSNTDVFILEFNVEIPNPPRQRQGQGDGSKVDPRTGDGCFQPEQSVCTHATALVWKCLTL